METVLKMEKIYKAFPGVVAVNKVDLEVNRGQVVALIGENGAGKSTLMKILSGAYTCDSGKIFIEGQEISGYTPKQAIDYGISVIYQELNYINYMTVAENILLGDFPKRKHAKFMIDKKEMARRSAKRVIVDKLGKKGKYSAKYALSELLVCGECGANYRRVTWTAKGYKEIKPFVLVNVLKPQNNFCFSKYPIGLIFNFSLISR